MPWNVVVICVTSKSSDRTGKLHMKKRFGELMGRIYPSGWLLSVTRSLRKIKRSSFSLVKRSFEASWAVRCVRGRNLERRRWRAEKLDALDIHARRQSEMEVLIRKKGCFFSYSLVHMEQVIWQEKFKRFKRSSLFRNSPIKRKDHLVCMFPYLLSRLTRSVVCGFVRNSIWEFEWFQHTHSRHGNPSTSTGKRRIRMSQ